MAIIQSITPSAERQVPPVVGQLRALFSSLDDAKLLIALAGPTRRGPKGHPVAVLWHCYIAKYALGLASTEALRRELRNNPFVAGACGIGSASATPHHSVFSRFFAKLASSKYLHLVKDVSRSLVRQCYEELPGFGQRVALDSTTLKGWVNGGKPKPSDREAGWSVKQNTHGRTEYTLGYKLHLLVDCESELPIAANINPGNVHDAKRATNVLSEARTACSKFRPKYVLADKGYSGKPLAIHIRKVYNSQPIIQVLPSHKRLMEQLRHGTPSSKSERRK